MYILVAVYHTVSTNSLEDELSELYTTYSEELILADIYKSKKKHKLQHSFLGRWNALTNC